MDFRGQSSGGKRSGVPPVLVPDLTFITHLLIDDVFVSGFSIEVAPPPGHVHLQWGGGEGGSGGVVSW